MNNLVNAKVGGSYVWLLSSLKRTATAVKRMEVEVREWFVTKQQTAMMHCEDNCIEGQLQVCCVRFRRWFQGLFLFFARSLTLNIGT